MKSASIFKANFDHLLSGQDLAFRKSTEQKILNKFTD